MKRAALLPGHKVVVYSLIVVALLIVLAFAAPVRAQDCVELDGSIIHFDTAHLSRIMSMGAVDDLARRVDDYRDIVDEEAAEMVASVHDRARWTFCPDGTLSITTFYEGEINTTYRGQWFEDNTFSAELVRNTRNSTSETYFAGELLAGRDGSLGAAVTLMSYGINAAVVFGTGYGSSYFQMAEYVVDFSLWEGPVMPDDDVLTRARAVAIFAELNPQARDVVALAIEQCRTAGYWQAYMGYEYYDNFLRMWMPWYADYLFRDLGNGRWQVGRGQC